MLCSIYWKIWQIGECKSCLRYKLEPSKFHFIEKGPSAYYVIRTTDCINIIKTSLGLSIPSSLNLRTANHRILALSFRRCTD